MSDTHASGGIRCPQHWSRVSTGGAWHVPDEDWIAGLVHAPLMHDCALTWGHDGDHYCECSADKVLPAAEGLSAPPNEVIGRIYGQLPLGALPSGPGGSAPPRPPGSPDDHDELSRGLQRAPLD